MTLLIFNVMICNIVIFLKKKTVCISDGGNYSPISQFCSFVAVTQWLWRCKMEDPLFVKINLAPWLKSNIIWEFNGGGFIYWFREHMEKNSNQQNIFIYAWTFIQNGKKIFCKGQEPNLKYIIIKILK